MKKHLLLIALFSTFLTFADIDDYNLYPNPCIDFLYLTNDNGLNQLKEVKIFNSIGKLEVHKVYDEINNSIVSIDIQDLTEGFYYVYIVQKDEQVKTLTICIK